MKVKYLVVAWLGVLVASWVIYVQYSSYSELCRGHVCTMLIVSLMSLAYWNCMPYISQHAVFP